MNGCAMVARLLSQRCGVWLRQKEGGGGDDGCLCQHGKVLTSTSLGPCPMGGIYRTCREVTSVEREEKAVSCNELCFLSWLQQHAAVDGLDSTAVVVN